LSKGQLNFNLNFLLRSLEVVVNYEEVDRVLWYSTKIRGQNNAFLPLQTSTKI